MKRTRYMQSIMDSTYPGIAIEAIKNGWDGAWERLIAQRLRIDYKSDHSEAVEIINAQTGTDSLQNKSMLAAYLITSSKIQSDEKELSNTN